MWGRANKLENSLEYSRFLWWVKSLENFPFLCPFAKLLPAKIRSRPQRGLHLNMPRCMGVPCNTSLPQRKDRGG